MSGQQHILTNIIFPQLPEGKFNLPSDFSFHMLYETKQSYCLLFKHHLFLLNFENTAKIKFDLGYIIYTFLIFSHKSIHSSSFLFNLIPLLISFLF